MLTYVSRALTIRYKYHTVISPQISQHFSALSGLTGRLTDNLYQRCPAGSNGRGALAMTRPVPVNQYTWTKLFLILEQSWGNWKAVDTDEGIEGPRS